MKTTLIIIASLLVIMVITQSYVSRNTTLTEQHAYKVLKIYKQFEIRKYEAALFSSVKMASNSYKETSSIGFRVLAGYIFGDNKKNEKIAMTTPVVMEMGDSTKMLFKVPANYALNELPQPNNSAINFEKQDEKLMAAIRFDGWASDEKIKKYTAVLKEALAQEKINHKNTFSYLGYNPPYEIFNRRNEIVVELMEFKSE
jgi:hypothetical protein